MTDGMSGDVLASARAVDPLTEPSKKRQMMTAVRSWIRFSEKSFFRNGSNSWI